MKKLYIVLLLFALMIMSAVVYQQHQLIKDYRSLQFGGLAIIQKPIEEILTFQKSAEQYNDEERAQLFELLYNAMADVFNHTGGGLQLEPQIREKYINEYFDTKQKYLKSIQNYKDAITIEERKQVHIQLQEQYDTYEKFLRMVEKELVEPI